MKPNVHIALFDRTSAKGKNDTTTEAPRSEPDWDKIGKIAQESSEALAKLVVITYVGKKLIDTACQIAVIAAKAKL